MKMLQPTFNTGYNMDGNEWSEKSALTCRDKTLTQQQFRDESDINILFGRYLESGEIPQLQDGLTYGDFEGIYDFQTAMNAVRTAEGLFQKMPARLRNRFANDPQKLLEFLADEENRAEAEFLGLVNKEPINEPGTGTETETDAQTGQRSAGTEQTQRPPVKTEKP